MFLLKINIVNIEKQASILKKQTLQSRLINSTIYSHYGIIYAVCNAREFENQFDRSLLQI